jgi:hypothetical protein
MADMGGGLPPTTSAPSLDSGDTAWMLAASALVLMMTLPGCAHGSVCQLPRWRGWRGRAAATPCAAARAMRFVDARARAQLRPRRLTLFYGGLVRAKNVLSMANSARFCVLLRYPVGPLTTDVCTLFALLAPRQTSSPSRRA